ncbi:hypothetical protein, variant [Exophiala mesophila]|uniref:Uncharacterized protein n=1 Tax=Exophiala mesophila TaxID=212818 RepID=A0A0D1ZL23_EXOME|nr:hypothetical protein, variant [Exophiala mesophila]KIV94629.1 hypothetical protein, variant [Exophiala mesophila]
MATSATMEDSLYASPSYKEAASVLQMPTGSLGPPTMSPPSTVASLPAAPHSFCVGLIPYLHQIRFILAWISLVAIPLSALAGDIPHIAISGLFGLVLVINLPVAVVQTIRRRAHKGSDVSRADYYPSTLLILGDIFSAILLLGAFVAEMVVLLVIPEYFRGTVFKVLVFRPWATVAPLAARLVTPSLRAGFEATDSIVLATSNYFWLSYR